MRRGEVGWETIACGAGPVGGGAQSSYRAFPKIPHEESLISESPPRESSSAGMIDRDEVFFADA
eukprot:151950-Chlamydomonas_euryale.AAC.1